MATGPSTKLACWTVPSGHVKKKCAQLQLTVAFGEKRRKLRNFLRLSNTQKSGQGHGYGSFEKKISARKSKQKERLENAGGESPVREQGEAEGQKEGALGHFPFTRTIHPLTMPPTPCSKCGLPASQAVSACSQSISHGGRRLYGGEAVHRIPKTWGFLAGRLLRASLPQARMKL